MCEELEALRRTLRSNEENFAQLVDRAINGSESDRKAFLVSDDLWGGSGSGSIADIAGWGGSSSFAALTGPLAPRGAGRTEIEAALIHVGERVVHDGLANCSVVQWLEALQPWQAYEKTLDTSEFDPCEPESLHRMRDATQRNALTKLELYRLRGHYRDTIVRYESDAQELRDQLAQVMKAERYLRIRVFRAFRPVTIMRRLLRRRQAEEAGPSLFEVREARVKLNKSLQTMEQAITLFNEAVANIEHAIGTYTSVYVKNCVVLERSGADPATLDWIKQYWLSMDVLCKKIGLKQKGRFISDKSD